MTRKLEVFVAVKGHAFNRDAFEAMLVAIGVVPTMVDQPAAAMLLNPVAMQRFDAILFYDMPGLDFRAPVDQRPAAVPPEPDFATGFEALLDAGKGIVALHHAIAGWPGWPLYAEALGGAFLYKPGTIGGVERPDSGYVGGIEYVARTAPVDHPVLDGIPPRFPLTDELYRFEIADDIVPLLYRDTAVPDSAYASAMRAVRRIPDGTGEAWRPAADSDIIGWAKAARASPLVYLQPGDDAGTYADPVYRRLVGNALAWVASDAARAWVRQRAASAP